MWMKIEDEEKRIPVSIHVLNLQAIMMVHLFLVHSPRSSFPFPSCMCTWAQSEKPGKQQRCNANINKSHHDPIMYPTIYPTMYPTMCINIQPIIDDSIWLTKGKAEWGVPIKPRGEEIKFGAMQYSEHQNTIYFYSSSTRQVRREVIHTSITK